MEYFFKPILWKKKDWKKDNIKKDWKLEEEKLKVKYLYIIEEALKDLE
jgi:hypothetical protein